MKIGSVNSNNQSQSFGISYSKKAQAKIMEFCKTPDLKNVLDNFATKNTKLRRIKIHNTQNGDILELNFRLNGIEGSKKLSTKFAFDLKTPEDFVQKVILGANRVEQTFITSILLAASKKGQLFESTSKLQKLFPHKTNFISKKSENYYFINSKYEASNDEIQHKSSFFEKFMKIFLH